MTTTMAMLDDHLAVIEPVRGLVPAVEALAEAVCARHVPRARSRSCSPGGQAARGGPAADHGLVVSSDRAPGEPRRLDLDRRSADRTLTFRHSYDVRFPERGVRAPQPWRRPGAAE